MFALATAGTNVLSLRSVRVRLSVRTVNILLLLLVNIITIITIIITIMIIIVSIIMMCICVVLYACRLSLFLCSYVCSSVHPSVCVELYRCCRLPHVTRKFLRIFLQLFSSYLLDSVYSMCICFVVTSMLVLSVLSMATINILLTCSCHF